MVDPLSTITLAQFVTDEAAHHDLYPLLAEDGVLCGFERPVVVVVDAVEGWRNFRFFCEEGGGFGDRHGCVCVCVPPPSNTAWVE